MMYDWSIESVELISFIDDEKSRNDRNQTESNLRCFRHMLRLKLDSLSASFLMKLFRYLLRANKIKGALCRDGRLCSVFSSTALRK